MGELLEMVIVDDEARVTQSLEREIRLEFGTDTFGIVAFNSPLDAMSWIRANQSRIFLVISDLRMPEMDGSELLERIRADCPDIQTILLTAYTDTDNIQRAVSASIQSLLFKPWTKDRITAEVGKALRLWRLNKENQQLRFRIDDLLRTAGAFQRSLFSQAIPESRTVRFSVSFNPHEEYHCGGDFYDILKDDEGAYMIILGDVTGHGPKPAMIAGMVKTAIHSIIDSDKSLRSAPDRLLKRLNDQFCSMFACSPETLIALSAVHLSPARRVLAVATAGLPAVIHLRNGQPEVLRTPNHILGAFPDTEFYKIERFLQPGDHIILYTDGLVESIPSFFTVEPDAVTAALAEMTDYSAQAISDYFLAKLPGAAFTDDVTVLSLEILPDKS